jgi:acetyltransferase-like isoleucine patch superfamily enzyme/acyl carrier protein
LRFRRRSIGTEATALGQRFVARGRPSIRNDGVLLIGDDVVIVATPVAGHLVVSPGARITVGDRVRIGHGGAISAASSVDIGHDAALGAFVTIMDSDFHVAGRPDADATPAPVVVGAGAVIGHRSIVLPGAHIGEGATVAAGSVVSGVIASGTHVAGNPAEPIDGDLAGRRLDDRAHVGDVVAHVFHLPARASADLRPDDVAAWDSFGALRLLLALETTFGIVIDEQRMAATTCVGDLEALVASARLESGRAP